MSHLFDRLSHNPSSLESAPQGSEEVVVTKPILDNFEGRPRIERTSARQMPFDEVRNPDAEQAQYWESLIGSQGKHKEVSAVLLLGADDRKPLLRWSTKTTNHDLLWDPDDSDLVPTAGLSIQSVHGKRLI